MNTEHVHFKRKEPKKAAAGGIVATVCQPQWLDAPKRSLLPRRVTCPACLDWIARNYELAIAQVDALRKAAA